MRVEHSTCTFHLEPQTDAGAAYAELVGRYLGELDPQAPVRMERGFFGRLFGG